MSDRSAVAGIGVIAMTLAILAGGTLGQCDNSRRGPSLWPIPAACRYPHEPLASECVERPVLMCDSPQGHSHTREACIWRDPETGYIYYVAP